MEDGAVHYPARETPQGGVISPLPSNLYLHHVLDLWFEREVKPRLRGRALAVRFADDAVLAFEREEDARRVLAMLGKRFGSTNSVCTRRRPGWWTSAPRPGVRRAAPSASGLCAAGVHAPLGALPQGALGSEAQDGEGPTDARRAARSANGAAEPPPSDGGAVGGAAAEAA